MIERKPQWKVMAVMVLYHPDLNLLRQNLEAIAPQVDKMFLIDNTPDSEREKPSFLNKNVSYIAMHGNMGIAAAQNEGIRNALAEGAEMIYFLDQDSISPADIIHRLSDLYQKLSTKGIKVGALGALPINRATGQSYIPTSDSSEGIEGITEVNELISSGSMIPAKVLKETGGMMEELFIDGVDHEWCWRAASIGRYRFFIDNNSPLSHQLGGGDRRLLWRKVAMPSPVRTYYLYRNIFLLGKKKYVPKGFKIKNGVKLALKIFYYPLFISPRKEYAVNIFRGIRDGLRH